jgi:hypothetical protein
MADRKCMEGAGGIVRYDKLDGRNYMEEREGLYKSDKRACCSHTSILV